MTLIRNGYDPDRPIDTRPVITRCGKCRSEDVECTEQSTVGDTYHCNNCDKEFYHLSGGKNVIGRHGLSVKNGRRE